MYGITQFEFNKPNSFEMLRKYFIMIQHQFLRFNYKLFVQLLIAQFALSSIADLLYLILSITDIQMDLF